MSIILINILIQLRLRNVDGLNLLILKLCKPVIGTHKCAVYA